RRPAGSGPTSSPCGCAGCWSARSEPEPPGCPPVALRAMCGIVGYTGDEPALPVLLEGLARLEYRGYDSAGVALQGGARTVWRRRRAGKLSELVAAVDDAPRGSTTGIGHTRWATHGRPSEHNAHPHVDCREQLALVH